MKLHSTVVDKMMNAVANLSGHSTETKLRTFFESLDLTVYTRKEKNAGQEVLVETAELNKELIGAQKR